MDVPVKNQQGEMVDTISLDDSVFDVPMNHSLVHQALVIYQLNQRQGTHDTKTRGQVSGGGRKPWIQKHTGRARQGSIRAPQWRHGGIVFGPHPRDYRKELPRRMRRQALKCAISEKARQGKLICLDSLESVDGKTRSMSRLLDNLGVSGSSLVVTQGSQSPVYRAAHNLKNVRTLPVDLLNANELLHRDTVVITLDAARWAEEAWSAPPQRGRPSRQSSSPEAPAAAAPESGQGEPAAAPARRRRRTRQQEGEEA